MTYIICFLSMYIDMSLMHYTLQTSKAIKCLIVQTLKTHIFVISQKFKYVSVVKIGAHTRGNFKVLDKENISYKFSS